METPLQNDEKLSLFSSITADGVTYTAAEGYYIFAAIIDNAPNDANVTVEIVAGTDLASDVQFVGYKK